MQRAFSIAMALAAVALSAVLAWKSAPRQRDGQEDRKPSVLSSAPDAGDALSLDTTAPVARGAPRHVRFGVVLVTYDGAEGAPKDARPKSSALALAAKLATDATTDFHGAVQRGDTGSTDDVGRVARGVLEPGPEGVLFSLPVGGVSPAVDTPRGFWIVKRLE